jgi:hypothetical protein
MSDETRRHTLSDWLALHELDAPLCRRILDAGTRQLDGMPREQGAPALGAHPLDPEAAWLRAVDALGCFFPAQRSLIEDTFGKIARVLVSDDAKRSQRALTLDNGPAAYPTIIYRFRGKPSDAVVIAHEFGHALQITASKGKFVTPVMREVSAFIGEMALLSHSLDADAVQYRHLSRVWQHDSRKYFESDGRRLEQALHDRGTAYSYCWNYPIARYIATTIAGRGPREHLWTIFEGGVSVRQVLGELDGSPQPS